MYPSYGTTCEYAKVQEQRRTKGTWMRQLLKTNKMYLILYVQGGEDPQAALSCKSFFTKEPLIIGLFCGQ